MDSQAYKSFGIYSWSLNASKKNIKEFTLQPLFDEIWVPLNVLQSFHLHKSILMESKGKNIVKRGNTTIWGFNLGP